MIDLIAHLVLAAVFMIGIRWVQLRPGYDVMSVGAVNYLAACALAVVMLLFGAGASAAVPGDLRAAAPTLLTGAGLGTGYFVAFFLLLRTLDLRGAAVSTALSRLAAVVPIALAVAIWGERPGPIQWVGIAVSMAAVIVMNAPQRSAAGAADGKGAWLIPLVFFLVAGGAFAAQETFSHVGRPAEQPLFLVCGFAVTAVGALAILVVRRITPSARELALAVILGAANGLQVLFLLRALDRLPGFLVFAVTGAGGVIGTAVMAAVVLRERPRGLRALGIAVAAVALVLLQA